QIIGRTKNLKGRNSQDTMLAHLCKYCQVVLTVPYFCGIGTGTTPKRASSAAPPSGEVMTQMPSLCRATECSHCEAFAPSTVTTVQSSLNVLVAISPRTSIGSIASTIPGLTLGPRIPER